MGLANARSLDNPITAIPNFDGFGNEKCKHISLIYFEFL